MNMVPHHVVDFSRAPYLVNTIVDCRKICGGPNVMRSVLIPVPLCVIFVLTISSIDDAHVLR